MGQLADRLGDVLRSYGWDPAAWAGELHALAFLEVEDLKEAHGRFLDLRRSFAVQRRADLLRSLAAFPFVRDVPPADARGMGLKEVESEMRAAQRSLASAREAAAALAEAEESRLGLARRALPPAPPLPEASWEALGPVAEAAEAERRRAAREARLEERIARAHRAAARLRHHRVDVPDLGSAAVPDPAVVDALLAPLEERLGALHALEDAHEAALAPARSHEARTWRRESARALEREAKALLERADHEGLAALQVKAEALRVEAARVGAEAARARRSGRAPPQAERRPGDPMDGYG